MATDKDFIIKNGLVVGGVLIVNSSGELQGSSLSGAVTATSLQLGGDANPTLTGDGTYLKITTGDGYIDIGAGSAGFLHITTDRPSFYFNKKLVVNEGIVQSYDEDLNLNRAGSTTARLRITAGTTISDQTFNVTGDVTATSFSDGTISGITFIDEDSFATNSATRVPTQQSVKAYVDAEVAGIVDSAPGALNTLNELAAALGDDANFSTTVTNSIAAKLPLAGGTVTGNTTFNTLVGVNKAINSSVGLSIGADATATNSYGLEVCNSTSNTRFLVDGVGSSFFYKSDNALGMKFDASTGNVGIGTTSPQYKFDVYGTDDITMRVHRPSSGLVATDTVGIGFSMRGDTATSSSDTRAGIFSTYNGNIFLATEAGGNLNSNPGDHARLYITGTGNVGIGTSTPAQPLHVLSSTALTAGVARFQYSGGNDYEVIRVESLGNNDAHIGFFADGDTNYYGGFGIDYSDAGKFKLQTDNLLVGGSNLMTWDRDGNVGIGTETPVAKNHIQGSGLSGQVTASWILDNTSSGAAGMDIVGAAGASRWRFLYTGATAGTGTNTFNESMCIGTEGTYAGNVGIGTTSPAHLLDVVGDSGDNTFIRILGGAGSTQGGVIFGNNDSTNEYGKVIWDNASNRLRISHEYASGELTFETNSTERFRIDTSGVLRTVSGNYVRPMITPTSWGYSSGYRAVILGSASTDYTTQTTGAITLSLNYDPSGNASGSFQGDGREILMRRGTRLTIPDYADSNWHHVEQYDSLQETSGTTTNYFQVTRKGAQKFEIGSSADQPGYSAAQIKALRPDAQSGAYWIRHEGKTDDQIYQVYCDMETLSGGWTMCACFTNNDADKTDYWWDGDSSMAGNTGTDWFTAAAGNNLQLSQATALNKKNIRTPAFTALTHAREILFIDQTASNGYNYRYFQLNSRGSLYDWFYSTTNHSTYTNRAIWTLAGGDTIGNVGDMTNGSALGSDTIDFNFILTNDGARIAFTDISVEATCGISSRVDGGRSYNWVGNVTTFATTRGYNMVGYNTDHAVWVFMR